ncbi:MAG: serine/threonine-protein kinase [Verrucomicrobiales bacterium]
MSDAPPADCPSDADLAELLAEGEPPGERERHLSECAACRERLESLAGTGAFHVPDREAAAAAAAHGGPGSEHLDRLVAQLVRQGGPRDAPPPGPDPAGFQAVGGYEVRGEIARGGMGVVLRGYDPALDREVAIKLLAPHLAALPGARERFLREARSAAAIHHPNVVPIFHIGEDAGAAAGPPQPYLVMPLIAGESAQARVERTGAFSPDAAAHLAAGVAAGLAAAHELGLTHRDIKPANILLAEPDDRPMLTDFGLARATDDKALTLDGALTGTPQFMAPEVARGEKAGPASDVYSLGSLVYFLASGAPPADGNTSLEIVRRVAEAKAPKLPPGAPPWIAGILRALMDPDPARRPSAAGAESLLASRTAPAARPPKAAPLLAAALACFALGGIGAWAYWGNGDAAPAGHVLPAADSASPAGGSDPEALPFALGDSGAAFATLSEAAEAVPAGGEILIRASGEIAFEPISLRGKPLAIRAAPGYRPALIATDGLAPCLDSDAALELDGLVIAQRRPGDDAGVIMPPILRVNEAPLTLRRCRITRDAAAGRRKMPAAFILNFAPALTIEGTEIYSPNLAAFRIRPRASESGAPVAVAIRNSQIVALQPINFADPEAAGVPQAHEIAIERSFIAGGISCFTLSRRTPPVEIRARRSGFSAAGSLIWLTNRPARAEERLRWKGEQNFYGCEGEWLSQSDDPLRDKGRPGAGPTSLAAWRDHVGSAEEGSVETGDNIFRALLGDSGGRDTNLETLRKTDLSLRRWDPSGEIGPDMAQLGPPD